VSGAKETLSTFIPKKPVEKTSSEAISVPTEKTDSVDEDKRDYSGIKEKYSEPSEKMIPEVLEEEKELSEVSAENPEEVSKKIEKSDDEEEE